MLDITAYSYDLSSERRSEAQMVRSILNLLEAKTHQGRYPT